MKKIVVIFLLLIYGSATMGATVHLHYCMNQIVGWSLLHNKDEKCGKCGMEEKDKEGCCKDEKKQVKLKTDHQKAGVSTISIIAFAPVTIAPVGDFSLQVFNRITERYTYCHAPPDIGDTKLHLLHCVFLV